MVIGVERKQLSAKTLRDAVIEKSRRDATAKHG
jgi:hypothetical protein